MIHHWVILVCETRMSQAEDDATSLSQLRFVTIPPGPSVTPGLGLSYPLSCLPLLWGLHLQIGFLLAAGQFHFLVDTQTTPKLTSSEACTWSSFLTQLPSHWKTENQEDNWALLPSKGAFKSPSTGIR